MKQTEIDVIVFELEILRKGANYGLVMVSLWPSYEKTALNHKDPFVYGMTLPCT